jgi:hypothetical protein
VTFELPVSPLFTGLPLVAPDTNDSRIDQLRSHTLLGRLATVSLHFSLAPGAWASCTWQPAIQWFWRGVIYICAAAGPHHCNPLPSAASRRSRRAVAAARSLPGVCGVVALASSAAVVPSSKL